MAKGGRAGAALATAAIGSFVAETLATVLVTFCAPVVAVERQQGHPVLRVEDSGPGIAPADWPRVLEPFRRVPGSSADGSGLGLPIVKEICKHEGLELLRKEGPQERGLRVRVKWPAG